MTYIQGERCEMLGSGGCDNARYTSITCIENCREVNIPYNSEGTSCTYCDPIAGRVPIMTRSESFSEDNSRDMVPTAVVSGTPPLIT